eukprot:CAMPEP_0185577710 /NCGR_PEP_ID=MMETSP0434-20130131/10798_1 /TAXON_ID=626734 ORGANISM="Favella taraikaensis, Strain Fe Narragansett Bay" /NCGR_SAMPLE_ID=MMETSP0434 /ASSEMBLY_ACC=CAM_ASM_000379 /LENGTH=114 /DNA_ID=CAMNT_0028195347 /DNA_START=183 /DNA_END=524 /DNA_ORIENTATION=-
MRSSSELGIEATAAIEGLQLGVASNVSAANENAGDSALASLALERRLDGVAVGQLVKLNELVLDVLRSEQVLSLHAERAPALRVDDHLVAGDVSIDLISKILCHPFVCFSLGSN